MTPAERRRLLRDQPDQKPEVKYTTDEDGNLIIDKSKQGEGKRV